MSVMAVITINRIDLNFVRFRDQYELVDSSEEERKSVDVCFDSEEDSDVNVRTFKIQIDFYHSSKT